MASEDIRARKCGGCSGFGVDDGYNRKSRSAISNDCYDTDNREIDSVVKAASVVYSMRNKEFGIPKTKSAYLTKKVEEEIERNRDKSGDLEYFARKITGFEYEFGDMVWGKVKSYPWWPGQIFNEAFAVSCVQETKREGHLLVAFFGDNSYRWLDPMELVPFDPYYNEKSKQTNSKAFVNAVEEAEYEVSRRAAFGLLCGCTNRRKLRPTSFEGFLKVDVIGYQPGGLYTIKQIKSARAGFESIEMLDFVKKLSLMPGMSFERSVHWIKNVAIVLAYRKAVFNEYDETYTEALGAQPLLPVHLKKDLVQQYKMLSRAEDFAVKYMEASEAQPAFYVNSRMVLARQVNVPSKASLNAPVNIATSVALSKISAVPTIVKDQIKRNEDFYKQKDASDILRVHHIRQGCKSFSTLSVEEASPASENPILQKRDAPATKKREFPCHEERNYAFGCLDTAPSSHLPSKKAAIMDKKPSIVKTSLVEVTVDTEVSCTKLVDRSRGFLKAQPMLSILTDNDQVLDNVQVVGRTLPPLHARFPGVLVTSSDTVSKMPKVLRRSANELTTEKKMKRIKRESKLEMGMKRINQSHESLNYVTTKSSYGEIGYGLPSALKPPKKRLKPDDYGRLRRDSSVVGSEKMPSKGLEKLNELESLSAEKKVSNEKSLKSQGRGRKETDVEVPLKPIKMSVKKVETPTIAKPTMLVLKFPDKSTLPSVSELKARFARFGPFDHSPCVIWKSSTCRIVFKYESDAQIARRYAVQNRSFFGDVNVHYDVQALQVPAPVFPTSSIQSQEEALSKETDVNNGRSTEPESKALLQEQAQRIYPKSGMKKQQGDEPQSVGSPTGKRVIFMLSEDEGNREKLSVVNNIIQNSNGNQPSDISSSSHATLDDNAKNFKKAMLPLPPWLPLSYRIPRVLENHEVYQFVEACNIKYFQLDTKNNHTPDNQNADVSSAILNLLMQCSTIVADVKRSLGYVPYNI